MKKGDLAELLKTQKSLTEWYEDIKHTDLEAIRREDNEKRERLKVLNEVIDLPFDKPTQFNATELSLSNRRFKDFLKENGNDLCALRLMPKEAGLPKLRIRGKTIKDAYDWYTEQGIDSTKYRADFIPHTEDSSWATIFIVNKYGIQGEIIFGGHHQLTQGFYDTKAPSVFRFDFKKWTMAPKDDQALNYLKKIVKLIHVTDKSKQKQLKEKLGSTFVNDFLVGYFETTDSHLGTWYIDYSKTLGDLFADTIISATTPKEKSLLNGQTGSPGRASGAVHIVSANDLGKDFPEGSILVCKVTTPSYVPLMLKAKAIITDQGGILSHAAIVARELHKPCIVDTGSATKKLKNGDLVIVDADRGKVMLA